MHCKEMLRSLFSDTVNAYIIETRSKITTFASPKH